MANNYVSQFTGDELDFAISSALGDKYRGNLSPGCHTVGASMDMQVDFESLVIPGKYTAYFYINGPTTLIGVSPVCIQVFWGSTMLYQTIQVGSRLFWRDMMSGDIDPTTGKIAWKEVDLGVEAAVIVDNLVTDLAANDKAATMALSANMGAELRKRIENLQIGNTNLIDFSNVFDDYFHAVGDRWAHNNNATIEDKNLDTCVAEAYRQRFPMVDDVDRDDVTIFAINGSGSFSFRTEESNRNPIQMANKSVYTASVYVLCQNSYFNGTGDNAVFAFEKDSSPNVYLKIVSSSGDVLAFTQKSLYQLFEEPDIVYTYKAGDKSKGEAGERVQTTNPSVGKTNGYVRLTVTYTATSSGDTLGIQFGMEGNTGAIAQFVYPKVEYGQYATQYNHSWQDLYYFFNNCEQIYGRTINIDDPGSHDAITEQSGLVFKRSTEEFEVEPVAVGGGGGFLQTSPDAANTNPRKDKIIIFDAGYSTVDNAAYRIRGLKAVINGAWTTLCNSPMTLATASNGYPTKVIQADCGWLDYTDANTVDPAILKYWDPDNKRWRPVGAVATQIWFKQPDVPTDPSKRKLIWIKSDTRAPYIYDPDLSKWVPLLALWGSPNT